MSKDYDYGEYILGGLYIQKWYYLYTHLLLRFEYLSQNENEFTQTGQPGRRGKLTGNREHKNCS